ncbi:MAG: serine hydrolase domain-containing protein [Planktomarina sp.]
MKKVFKWVIYILLATIVLLAAVALWKREDIKRLLAVNSLFSEEKIVHNFSNMNGAFLNATLDRGAGPVSALPPSATEFDLTPDMQSWITDHNVTALVVLQGGETVYENYFLDTKDTDRRISWSVAKSFVSALMGILLEEGSIASIDDPVTKYVPDLAGSAYDQATIKDVLQMSSGVKFNEDYLDYDSDINKMDRTLGLGGSMDAFAAGLSEMTRPAGTQFQYVSIDTHILGMVIRGATGRSVIDLLSEKVIQPLGLEADPYYVTDGYGVAFVLGGLNLRTRDYARFGMMVAQDGYYNGQQIVPAAWIEASVKPTANVINRATGYGYQWWIPHGFSENEVLARGIYDQFIYIDRARDIVIALNSANRNFRGAGVQCRNNTMFQTIAAQVSGE